MPEQKIVGNVCSQCGIGKYVLSPKSGKTFCSEKCWLKGGQAHIVPPPPVKSSEVSSGVSKEVWEQKDRLYAAQTALNCVAQIYQGHGDKITDTTIETRFKKFYSLLREAKMGLMSSPAKENPPQIPLEDIPF